MSLVLPSEIVVNEVLPVVRPMLARELADAGLTQQTIANNLGVTQAAVSSYLNSKPDRSGPIAGDPRTQATIERIATGLADEQMDGYDALAELMDLIATFEDRGPICELHEEAMPSLRGLSCDLCVRGIDSTLATERETLANVRRAARLLATADGITEAIPNVGTNIGMALPGAADITDVAAVPGRIYSMRGRVEVPSDPEFGASSNVSTMILAAQAVDETTAGALNLVTSDALLAAAQEHGIEPLRFDADYEDRDERLRERFQSRDSVPRVVYHEGAFGIEPITYVLGETAVDATELAVSIAETMSDPTNSSSHRQ